MLPFQIGILAAGLGSRMQERSKAKPLANLAGQSILARLTSEFFALGATQITCALRDELLNSEDRESLPKNISYLFVNTDSSLHTLQELINGQGSATSRTLFSMVDTIMHRNDLEKFLQFCSNLPINECALLVTSHVDDEKPLWVAVNDQGYVTQFSATQGNFITSGMYLLTPEAMEIAEELVKSGVHKMRNFLSHLAERNIPIKTFVVKKTIDVDHPSDLDQAESFLRKN